MDPGHGFGPADRLDMKGALCVYASLILTHLYAPVHFLWRITEIYALAFPQAVPAVYDILLTVFSTARWKAINEAAYS